MSFGQGQFTLRAGDQQAARRDREQIICHLLGLNDDIGEVILYEAADWTYFLPLSDPDLRGHGFLDRWHSLQFEVHHGQSPLFLESLCCFLRPQSLPPRSGMGPEADMARQGS
ncbi:MAG: hypothetical protein ACC628_12840 [Pirellulaceae bacterium]